MIGITMRVMRHCYPGGDVEERDALARDWPRFMGRVFPQEALFCLPNMGAKITGFAGLPHVSGLIFSGGEDWGLVPERDATEAALFAWARREGIPIFGVCRGAQVINLLLGGRFDARAGHVAVRHSVELARPVAGNLRHEVNSFHAQGIPDDGLAPGLEALAVAPDGTVEAFASADGLIAAVMWHPEREPEPAPMDVELLRHCLLKPQEERDHE